MTDKRLVIDKNTLLSEIFDLPLFKKDATLFFGKGKLPPKRFMKRTLGEYIRSIDENWDADDAAIGLNRFIEASESGRYNVFNVYSDSELKRDKTKKNMNLIFFEGKKDAPYFVVCPGGAYMKVCSIFEGYPVAAKLNSYGYNAFVLNYRAGIKGNVFERSREDLIRSLQFIDERAAEFGVNSNTYGLIGFSAGGHLVTSFCTDNLGYKTIGINPPAAVIAAYPLLTYNRNLYKLLRFVMSSAKSKIRFKDTDVIKYTGHNFPPVFLWNTVDDKTVDAVQSELFDKALSEKGVQHIYRRFLTGGHGAGLAKNKEPQNWFAEAMDFFKVVTDNHSDNL